MLHATRIACAGPDEPQWLVDARAVEGKLTGLHTLTSADRKVRFEVPLPLHGKLVQDKDGYSATFLLGPGVEAACHVAPADVNVASLLRESGPAVISELSPEQQQKLEKRIVEKIDAGAVGPTPYLYISWLYRVREEKGAVLGVVREYAASRYKHGVFCLMDNIGYTRTFEKLALSFIGTLQMADEEAAPYYSEVSIATLQDVRIGYSLLELRRDSDGDTKITESTSFLIAPTPEALQSYDSDSIQWATPEGRMINGVRVIDRNGETESNLALSPGEQDGWVVKGTFHGKEISETIPGEAPSTWLFDNRLRRELLARDKPVDAEAIEKVWLSADPGKFTDSTVRVVAAIDERRFTVRETLGGGFADYVVDRQTGLSPSAVVQVGRATVNMTQVYQRGSP